MVKDLSKHHEPVSDFLRVPASAAEWEQCRLSDEQVEFFHENGYLKGIRMLDDEQVEVLRGELSQIMDPEHPGRGLWYEYHSNESKDPNTVLFHALGAWRIAPGFHDLLWNPRFTVPASQLLGGAVRLWHDQLFCKPVAIELKAGEASSHHPRMIHGSYANSTGRPRRATVVNVFRGGVRSNSDDPPLAGVPAIPKGRPMGGRFFPLPFNGRRTTTDGVTGRRLEGE
jgi:hypothetical protein